MVNLNPESVSRATDTVIDLPKMRGGNRALVLCHDHEVILVGGADIGKTWAACVKSLLLCTDPDRPKVHGAICRKVHATLEHSVLRTFQTIAAGLPIRRVGGQWTDKYIFPNGSQIVAVGLDKADKLLSSEWDFVQVCQSEELTESDWELVASRCTGRGAVVKHPQIFGDCNPSGTQHWIPKRAKAGHLTLLKASHQDNPALYDAAGNVTPEGVRRLSHLDKTLTGVRRQRLLLGQWATAEGAVYDMFNSSNVTTRDRKQFQRFMLAMDEGYTNPAVILLVGEDNDGRLHVFKEFYERGVLQSTICNEARDWCREWGCHVIVVDDSAAGLIAELSANGLNAKPAGKGKVQDGIRLVQNALVPAGDGRPRLTVDPSCTNLINEFESYRYRDGKDEPLKEYDHALDALRYLYTYLNIGTGAWSEEVVKGIRVGQADYRPDSAVHMDDIVRI